MGSVFETLQSILGLFRNSESKVFPPAGGPNRLESLQGWKPCMGVCQASTASPLFMEKHLFYKKIMQKGFLFRTESLGFYLPLKTCLSLSGT